MICADCGEDNNIVYYLNGRGYNNCIDYQCSNCKCAFISKSEYCPNCEAQVDDDYKDEIEVDCDLMQYIDAVVSVIICVNLILYKHFDNIVA